MTKNYQFTDEQIDQLLRLVRNKAFQVLSNSYPEKGDTSYNELANLIEDQITNHLENDWHEYH
jgi:hypothetical protein